MYVREPPFLKLTFQLFVSTLFTCSLHLVEIHENDIRKHRCLQILSVCIYNVYYMVSSASGHCDWLPERARWSHLARSGLPGVSSAQAKFHQKPYNKSFIDQVCSVKMAGYWPRSFLASLWTSTSSRSINTRKRTWPISSHLDLTLGQ